MYILCKEDLKKFIESMARKSEVYTPQKENGQVMLLPYEEAGFTMDYINFAFPVKEHLFMQREILFNWQNDNGKISVQAPKEMNARDRIYFGVRPCDIYGIRYMDKFFLEGYRDEFYGNKREAAAIIAVNCIEAGENCFCSSMDTGPFADSGYDLLCTPLKDVYLVEVGTEKGEKLIAYSEGLTTQANEGHLAAKELAEKITADGFNTKINADNIRSLLEENFSNPLWQELSRDCISCTGCTSLCPTCTCFNVVEESRASNSGCRVRCWDSCQSDSFTRNAKNHNPRSKEARVRYRIYDKFKYIEDKFGMKGCTGCGRCINVCPASINVVDIINKLADSSLSAEGCEDK